MYNVCFDFGCKGMYFLSLFFRFSYVFQHISPSQKVVHYFFKTSVLLFENKYTTFIQTSVVVFENYVAVQRIEKIRKIQLTSLS